MRTLFLNPPSYGGFDGGAGARYQARREIRSLRKPCASHSKWIPTAYRYRLQPLIPVLRILGEMLHDRDEFRRRVREGREFFSFMARRREVVEAR